MVALVEVPELVNLPIAQVITFWRPGSHDWTWKDEYVDLHLHHSRRLQAIRRRVIEDGFKFLDHVSPILLGSDGRVWDGHHRICLAIELGEPFLNVEKA